MKNRSILFLKVVILLIAIAAIIWLIWFPKVEGRAVNLDLISIYKDPFIIYGYLSSIPFFVGLYQVFMLLGYINNNKLFSQRSIKAVKTIKYCAIIIAVLIVLGILYIRFSVVNDDPAGANALGIFIILASIIVAIIAFTLERNIQIRVKK